MHIVLLVKQKAQLRKSMLLSGRNEAGADWMSPGGGNGLGAV